MSVRAKFRVLKIERTMSTHQTGLDDKGHARYEPCELQTVVLSPVFGNGDPEHENTKFWNASPSGEVRLGTINAAAAAYFELSAEYYLDFTKAE